MSWLYVFSQLAICSELVSSSPLFLYSLVEVFFSVPPPVYFLCTLRFIFCYIRMHRGLSKSSLPLDIVNKVLLENGHTHSLTNGLCLLFTTAESSSWGRDQYDLQSWKRSLSGPLQKQLPNSWNLTQSPVAEYLGSFWCGAFVTQLPWTFVSGPLPMCMRVSLHYILKSGFKGVEEKEHFQLH